MNHFKIKLIELSKYIFIAIAVAIGVVTLGWILKELAQLKLEVAQDSKQIAFLAKDAKIHGKGEARVENFKGETDIGWWDFKSQFLSWKFPELTKSALYQVEIRYSRASSDPCRFNLKTAAFEKEFTLPGTGDWGNWRTLKLFQIELPPNQSSPIFLKALDPPTKGIINFIYLKLTLIDSN